MEKEKSCCCSSGKYCKSTCIATLALCISLFIEKIASFFLYDYLFNFRNYIETIFISLLISYPSFYFFYKIDHYK